MGHDGAARSNLTWGSTGPSAIDNLVRDGDLVGHRRTMLNPQILSMGSGSVPQTDAGVASEAQLMVDNPSPPAPQRPARDEFVAWPPKGFVPYQTVYPRWSFVLRGGDFTNATVRMQRPNGAAMPAAIESRADFAGPGIVWLANNLVDDCSAPGAPQPCADKWPQPVDDEPVTVTVANVVVGGVARDFTYTVTVFDPAVGDPSRTPLVITGPDRPPLNQTSTYSVNAIPNALGYQWRTTKLTPLDLTDGAEAGLGNFDAVVGGYDPISTNFAATGTSAFRLTTGQPGGVAGSGQQTLTLKRALVPDVNSQLTFKTRANLLDNVTAVVEVSADDGVTWNAVYTERATRDTAFNDRAVPLGQLAGQHLQLRFRVQNAGTGGTFSGGSEGWYFDDVTLNNLHAADAATLTEVSAATSFNFNPTDLAEFDLNVRPQFFGSGFAAWSPTKRVSTLPPAVAPAITVQPQNMAVGDGGAASFTVSASGTPPLSFVWSHNGTDLVDGAGVSGSREATLSLTNVHVEQAGAYRVQVSNTAGIVTSNDAVLTVNPPPPPPNGLTAALDDPQLQWLTGGDSGWTSQAAVTHDGVDAARSGAIGDNQTSSLDTTVTGPATLSFWWKVDSELNFDFLTVTVDGAAPFPGISGNVDWQQKTLALPAGAHTIHWAYTKDGSVSAGQNAAWLDQMTVGPPQAPLTLADAVDNPGVALTTTGDLPWTAQTGVTHDGVDAARSGAIGDNQTSSLDTTVTGPATLSFWWKVDSELNFDFLTVTVDGAAPFPGISGNVDWQQKTLTLPAGAHTIHWAYTKDGSVSAGQNAAWLDQMTIAPG